MNTIKSLGFGVLGLLLLTITPQNVSHGQCSSGTCGGACPQPAAPQSATRQPAACCPSEAASWCSPQPACCPEQACECTVLVPKYVTEYRTETVTRYRPEKRERTFTVYREVPDTKTVEEQYTVMVPETRTRTVVDTINRPVYRDLGLRITTMKSQVEARQSTRQVCRMVPVQEQRTVSETVDPGASNRTSGWVHTVGYRGEKPSEDIGSVLRRREADKFPAEESDPNAPPAAPDTAPALGTTTFSGSSCPTCVTCGPQVVQRTINVTCMKPVLEKETVEYPVTSFQPNVRAQTVAYFEYEPEKVSREEQYVFEVPQTKVRTREVSVTRKVPEQRQEEYTVTVPYQVQIKVPVQKLVYVRQRIVQPPPACEY